MARGVALRLIRDGDFLRLSWVIAAPYWRARKALWLAIVRAAPTCTLWVPDHLRMVLRFALHPSWVVTWEQFVEARWIP